MDEPLPPPLRRPMAAFVGKTYEMVEDPVTDAVVSWGPAGNTFVVWRQSEFSKELLPNYFSHSNFASFVRQLSTYGFRKVDPDRLEFANEGFLKGQKNLLKTICSRKHVQSQLQQPQKSNTLANAAIEVGKFALEEEVERLKRDKHSLTSELVGLRKQQQDTDLQLLTVGQHLQVMEQRQQQMISFLAKAIQSPGFLAQLLQPNDKNLRLTGVSKKQRITKQQNNIGGENASADSQIIKFQPLINEAAKAMFMQMLKMDTCSTSRLQTFSNPGRSFLIDDGPSSLGAGDSRSSTGNSEVTISKVLPTSSAPYVPIRCGFSAISEIQSPPVITDMVMRALVHDMRVRSPVLAVIPEFSQMQGIVSDGYVGVPIENYVVPEAVSPDRNTAAYEVDVLASLDIERFPTEDIIYDGFKLPDINNSFWEQIMELNPDSGDREEVDWSMEEAIMEMQLEHDDGWDDAQHVAHLTAQIRLLASDSQFLYRDSN